MATASENFQLLVDYYAAHGDGGPESVERMASFTPTTSRRTSRATPHCRAM